MEYEPKNPFELQNESDETGVEKTSKKSKKRTTKVPLPGFLKTEKEAAEQESEAKENVLEKLFERTEKQLEDKRDEAPSTESYSEEYDEAELAELSGVDTKPDPLEAPVKQEQLDQKQPDIEAESVNSNEQDAYYQEGEFSDEVPLIISKPETSTSAPNEEVPKSSSEPETRELEQPSPPEAEDDQVEVEAIPSREADVTPAAVESHPEPSAYESEERSRRAAFDDFYRERVSHTATPVESVIAEREANDRVHEARKQGTRRGVVSGLVFGWFLGRRGRKEAVRAAKDSASELKSKSKELDDLRSRQAISEERLSAVEQTKEHLERVLNRSDNITSTQPAIESVPRRQELEPVTKEQQTEVPPEDQEITEETYLAPKGTKLEQSAWHTIEVDEKTGRKVESPERAYGKEFANEQRQEKLRAQHTDPGLAVQFGHTVVQSSDVGQEVSDTTENQKISKKKRFMSPEQIAYVSKQIKSQATSPTIWVVAITVFLLLLVLGILR